MAFRALLDACVLAPYELSNLLLTLADEGLFTPLWSEDILAEVERTLVGRLGVEGPKATRRIDATRAAFPESMVTGYADLVPAMRNQRKDRHVLAAAIRGNAEVLVTVNLKDFPQRAADPYAIQIRHPDAFLSDQLDLDPHRTGAAIENLVSLYKAPRLDALELMCRLRVTVPNFAQLVGSQLVRGESFDMGPAMLVQSTSAEAFTSFVPTGDLDLSQPQNVAYHWWAAALNLPELHPLFDSLCLKPGDWKDRRTLDAMLDGLSLASGVDPAIETPDRMAFVKLVTVTGEESVQVFGAGTLKGPLRVITLVKVDDEWKVFALSDDYLPAARVFDDWSYRRS